MMENVFKGIKVNIGRHESESISNKINPGETNLRLGVTLDGEEYKLQKYFRGSIGLGD